MIGPFNTRRCSFNPFRRHAWGTWFNRRTGQYHSVCCSRCGLWWGDFVRKFPHLRDEVNQ